MDAQWKIGSEPESDAASMVEHRILMAVADERQRLAGELHDSLGGRLSGVAMGLRALQRSTTDEQSRQKLAGLADAIREGLEEIRTFSFALQVPEADLGAPFESVVSRFSTGFAQRAGLELDLTVAWPVCRINDDQAHVLIRVLQEALLNVYRHAQASAVSVQLTYEDGAASLAVRDDGGGMDLVEGVPRCGAGLMSMRERIKRAGGVLRFESGPAGTAVSACIPL